MLPRLLTDENVWPALVAGIRSTDPAIDVVTVQQVGLRTMRDDIILDWAARENRVVLTHGSKTLVPLANVRLA